MCSQIGAYMFMGKGSIYSTSKMQCLNTKSYTEAEIVGIDNVMLQIIWTRNFFLWPGYAIRYNIVYQDKKSIILPKIMIQCHHQNARDIWTVKFSSSLTGLRRTNLRFTTAPLILWLVTSLLSSCKERIFLIWDKSLLMNNSKQYSYLQKHRSVLKHEFCDIPITPISWRNWIMWVVEYLVMVSFYRVPMTHIFEYSTTHSILVTQASLKNPRSVWRVCFLCWGSIAKIFPAYKTHTDFGCTHNVLVWLYGIQLLIHWV